MEINLVGREWVFQIGVKYFCVISVGCEDDGI